MTYHYQGNHKPPTVNGRQNIGDEGMGLKQKALELRGKGYTYPQIVSALDGAVSVGVN